ALLATDDLIVEHVTAAYYLRQRYPDQFLEIHTGWIQHFALNENLMRHPHGDNEVFTLGVPPAIANDTVFFTYVEEFAYSDTPESGNGRWLREQGYIPLPGSPIVMPLGAILDYNPEALAYAYAVPEATIANLGYGQLLRSQTQPVTYY